MVSSVLLYILGMVPLSSPVSPPLDHLPFVEVAGQRRSIKLHFASSSECGGRKKTPCAVGRTVYVFSLFFHSW